MSQASVTVRTWGDAVFLAVTNAVNVFLTAVPLIIGALVILIIGWLISNLLARPVRTAVARAGADRMFSEHGGRAYGDAASRIVPSVVSAEVVKWLVRIVTLVAATNVLGLTQFSQLLNQVLLWIPNLIVAAVILLVAPVIARFVRGVIETAAGDMGFSNARLLGQLAEVVIVAFAVLVAVNQIGIAQNLIDILFIGFVGAVALAFGLAFGLGGRDVAAELTRDWYEASQAKAQDIAERRRPTINGRPIPPGGLVSRSARPR